MTMKKELIQTRNRKMNKKMIVKHEELEEDWTNNDDWLKSYNLSRAMEQLRQDTTDTPDTAETVDDLEEELDQYSSHSSDDRVYQADDNESSALSESK